MSPGESHLYEVTLGAEQLFTLTALAADLNFSLRLIAPGGDTSAEAVHTRYGPLVFHFIAPEAGRYQLAITSLETNAQPREYRIEVGEVRAATPRDKEEARAATSFSEAEVARLKWEDDGLRLAFERYGAAALLWQRQARWAEAALAWQQLGKSHLVQGDYSEALRAFNQALRASKRAGSVALTLEQLNNVAYVQVYLGNVEQAAALLRQVQARLGEVSGGDGAARARIEAQLQNNLGEVEYARGNLKTSLGLFAHARALWEEVRDRRGLALARLNAGYSQLDSGGINEAAQEFEQALRLWREVGDRQGEALTLTAQGNLYAHLGDRYTAVAAHREARDIFRRMGDRQGEAVTSNGLGKVFEDLNLRQQAVDNYSASLQLNRAIGNKDFEAVSAYYLGRVSRRAGDFARALTYYEQSLALSRRNGESRMAALASMDVAAIYTQQRKFADALRIYRQALDFYLLVKDLRRQALAHHGLGELFRMRGEPDEAAREYLRGLALFRQIKDSQGEAESHYWLAKLKQASGRLLEALTESEMSVGLIETQRGRMPSQDWRTTYFASVRRHFELHVDILMQLHRQQPERGFAALALESSERARARSLLEMLSETKSEIRRGVDPALLTREQQLRQQLSAKAAYQIEVLNSANPAAGEVSRIEYEIRQLDGDYDFVQAQIRGHSIAYARLTQPSPLTLARIQAALKEDAGTVLLEYMLGDERSYVWLVTPDALLAEELPGRQTLETLAREVYRGLTARQQQQPHEDAASYHARYTESEDQFCTRSGQLSRLILGPLRAGVRAERLLVVADGDLLYVPFDALPTPGGSGGEVCRLGTEPPVYDPLLTTYEVVHLPSFSSLALLRELNASARRPTQGIAIWADPVFESDDPRVTHGPQDSTPAATTSGGDAATTTVPTPAAEDLTSGHDAPLPARLLSTREEAESIMRFAPGGAVMLLTGFAASRESAVGQDLQDYRILHFATHGLVNNRYPSLTSLLLSTFDERGRRQNGLLQLHDIYGLRLNADLVVLSGCQTGLGEQQAGEGFVGLTQGFLYAGSRSIIVSLWNVQDQTTTKLMSDFYQAMLEEGVAPSTALRRAKLKMYRQGAWQSPYYWSAFVIQGEFRPPPRSWRDMLSTRTVWVGLTLAAVIFCLVYYRGGRHIGGRARSGS